MCVSAAASGKEALALLRTKAHLRDYFDIVLLDQNMPGMTGLELVREMRRVDNSVPVLLITAFATLEDAMEAGWQGNFPGGVTANAPLTSTYFNMRKTTIYGGSNEVQRNIVAQTVLG